MRPSGRPLPQNRWDLLGGTEPAEPPFVSVIVPHYRQQAELDRTLRALLRQDHPASRLEVIVVDDGSPEPPRVPAGVALVVHEDRGFRLSAARNAGAARASGDVLCFLDADTVPEPGYLRALTRLPALAPDVVTVGRRRHAELAGLPIDAAVDEIGPARELPEPQWLADAYARSRNLLDADDLSYRFLIGAVTSCSAALFRETGGYDESFERYGGEDWEWAYRAWLQGALFAHVPGAVAWHDGPEWAGRDSEADRRRDQNEVTVRLASLIPVPGSGPRGLRSKHADVVVTVPASVPVVAPETVMSHDGLDPEWFVSLDSVAAELPLAALPGDGRLRDRVRIEVALHRPARVAPGILRALLRRVDDETLGDLTARGPDGTALLTVTTTRAAARRRRWSDDSLFASVAEVVDGITPIGPEVGVAGYLGGWS